MSFGCKRVRMIWKMTKPKYLLLLPSSLSDPSSFSFCVSFFFFFFLLLLLFLRLLVLVLVLVVVAVVVMSVEKNLARRKRRCAKETRKNLEKHLGT